MVDHMSSNEFRVFTLSARLDFFSFFLIIAVPNSLCVRLSNSNPKIPVQAHGKLWTPEQGIWMFCFPCVFFLQFFFFFLIWDIFPHSRFILIHVRVSADMWHIWYDTVAVTGIVCCRGKDWSRLPWKQQENLAEPTLWKTGVKMGGKFGGRRMRPGWLSHVICHFSSLLSLSPPCRSFHGLTVFSAPRDNVEGWILTN